jgi:hypothetical protein
MVRRNGVFLAGDACGGSARFACATLDIAIAPEAHRRFSADGHPV